MLAAAHGHLLREGYAATTIPTVAAAAGVSAEFVYKNIGRKAGLLAAVLDVAIGGDDDPVPMADRPGIRALRELDSARDVLDGYVRLMAPVQERAAPLLMLAAQSADTDAVALVAKADAQRLTGMTGLARHLQALGGLHPQLNVNRTRDLLWTYTSPQLYDLLVVRRGWSLADYADHVRQALVAALLSSG